MIDDEIIHGVYAAPRCRARIEQDTPIRTRAIAEGVCEEVSVWLHEPLPRRWVRELVARANTIYARNRHFNRRVRGQGDRGRDYLWMFMRHWLAAMIRQRRAQSYARLPAAYCVGGDLPPRQR